MREQESEERQAIVTDHEINDVLAIVNERVKLCETERQTACEEDKPYWLERKDEGQIILQLLKRHFGS